MRMIRHSDHRHHGMANGVRNKLTPFCLKYFAARTITECEYQAIKLADHTHTTATMWIFSKRS
jgi:hypothetical protein